MSSKPSHVISLNDVTMFTAKHPDIKQIAKSQNKPSIHGNKIWDASLVMMDFLENFPLALDSRILDVGCGWGILSCYLAREYQGGVTGLDADTAVKPYFEFHGKENQVDLTFTRGTMKSMTKQKLSEFDVIVGCDICFWDNLKIEWQNLIRRAFQAGVSEIYITDPGRPPFWELVDYAEKHFNGEVWFHDIKYPSAIEQYVLELHRT